MGRTTTPGRGARRSRLPPLARALRASGEIVGGSAQIAVTALGAPLLRRWYLRWGATDRDARRALPGDELVAHPRLWSTRAVRIEASREQVWPWLVQIGQGRGGLYSFDALENAVGCNLHSADRILPEHQRLDVGDLVRAGPEGYPAWRVVDVEPARHLTLLAVDPRTLRSPPPADPVPARGYSRATWQWVLEPADAGRATRLLVRSRTACSPRLSPLWRLLEPVTFVMERRMLLGLRQRAERSARAGAAGVVDQ